MQSIQINLPDNIIASMNAAVECGVYRSQDDIVSSLLRDWDSLRKARIAELRELWEEGIASGVAEPFTLEELLAKVRAKYTEKKP